MKYTKQTEINENGTKTRETEVVDDAFVEKFISPETLEFFRNLGGTESVKKHGDGSIVVRSTSPDQKITRATVFVPLKEEEQ